jgi:hypothetical protein
MRLELYNKQEDTEVSLSSGSQREFTFKSEIKNLTFDFVISKFKILDDRVEKLFVRESYLAQVLDDKLPIFSNIKLEDPTSERLEVHFRIYDQHMNSLYFYFDLGSNWTGGGRFFIRNLNL